MDEYSIGNPYDNCEDDYGDFLEYFGEDDEDCFAETFD